MKQREHIHNTIIFSMRDLCEDIILLYFVGFIVYLFYETFYYYYLSFVF